MMQNLPSPEILEKLAAATSVEEVEAVLATERQFFNKDLHLNDDLPLIEEPETPNQAYNRLRLSFALELEGVVVSRQEAAQKYTNIDYASIARWEAKGLVRVIERAKRRGMPSKISERDVAILSEMNRLFRDGKTGTLKGFRPPVRKAS
jgi:hypothetical protein